MDIIKGPDSNDVEIKDASDFLKALRAGKTPQEAASDIGKPLAKMIRSERVIKGLEDLKDYYFKDAQIRKAIVLARNTQIVMEGADRDVPAASRILALDPELGLTGNQSVQVNIQLVSEDVMKLDVEDVWEEDDKESKS